MAKGVPKRDGSGGGVRSQRGRGGCNPPKDKGLKSKSGKGLGRGLGRGLKNRQYE